MKKIDKNSPIPLYYQLKTIIAELIENEEYKPGEAIPTEKQFCEIHDISRMTVSKTINSLINEGLLYRERGKGTFVAKDKKKHRLSALLSFTEDMQKKGLQVETRLLSFERKAATKMLEKTLLLPDRNKDVYEIIRLRCCEDGPYALETVYLAAYLCDGLVAEMVDHSSLYEVLDKRFNCQINYAYQTIEPLLLSEYESKVLEVKAPALALLFSRHTYLKNDVPIEVTRAVYRSDRYKFEIELHR